MKKYNVIGLMSGSSMDGVDIAYCSLENDGDNWSFEIKETETTPYNETWRVRLSQLRKQSALTYVKTDVFYGHFLAEIVNNFISKNNITEVDFIASHGHTIFHYPEQRITAQVGDGESIAAITGIPVISNFRRMDTAKNGQGAPLVTIGDKLFFNEYDYCINLGGFANISGKDQNGNLTSFDIGPCNIPLNRIARDLGKSYDNNGEIAERGKIDYELLGSLNAIEYYKKSFPKTLNRDWINDEFWSIIRDFRDVSSEDKMKTIADHIAVQIASSIDLLAGNNGDSKKIIFTGGGTHNKTLIELIKTHSDAEIIVPDSKIIDYKESIIFCLLGALRIQNKTNTISSATGAFSDSIGGSLHGDFSALI